MLRGYSASRNSYQMRQPSAAPSPPAPLPQGIQGARREFSIEFQPSLHLGERVASAASRVRGSTRAIFETRARYERDVDPHNPRRNPDNRM